MVPVVMRDLVRDYGRAQAGQAAQGTIINVDFLGMVMLV